jgi:hypothetical protein
MRSFKLQPRPNQQPTTHLPTIQGPATRTEGIALLAGGILFGGLGIALALAATGVELLPAEGEAPPLILLGGLAVAFIGSGIFLLHSAIVRLRKIQPDHMHAHPSQQVDYWRDGWTTELNPASLAKAMWRSILGLAVVTMLLLAAIAMNAPAMFMYLFGAFGAALLFGAISSLRRALRYAPSRLEIGREFFLPGETIRVNLHCDKGLDVCEWIELDLQYIRQTNDGEDIRHEILYTNPTRIEGTEFPGGIVPHPLPITIPQPKDKAWPNSLETKIALFWILSVHAKTQGLDYRSKFILPIYSGD